jgi:hypothetical protein
VTVFGSGSHVLSIDVVLDEDHRALQERTLATLAVERLRARSSLRIIRASPRAALSEICFDFFVVGSHQATMELLESLHPTSPSDTCTVPLAVPTVRRCPLRPQKESIPIQRIVRSYPAKSTPPRLSRKTIQR